MIALRVLLAFLSVHLSLQQGAPAAPAATSPLQVPNVSGSVQSNAPYQWGLWGNYGSCSASCGSGQRSRQRLCFFYRVTGTGFAPSSGQNVQTGQCPCAPGGNCNIDTQPCNAGPCGPCVSQWSVFGQCTGSCGSGVQVRQRTCLCASTSPECSVLTESQPCPLQACYGTFGEWGVWGECSKQCGSGTQTRSRGCVGGPCPPGGQTTDTRVCNLQICGWGAWNSWSSCDFDTCQQKRERFCPSNTCTSGHFIRLRNCRNTNGCRTIPPTRTGSGIAPTQPPRPVVPRRTCAHTARVVCGPPGIDKDQCTDNNNGLGCCWDDSIQGLPSCYFAEEGATGGRFNGN